MNRDVGILKSGFMNQDIWILVCKSRCWDIEIWVYEVGHGKASEESGYENDRNKKFE